MSHPSDYGVFANVVAIAATLVIVFAALSAKMLGRIGRWTFLLVDAPTFMVAAGARTIVVGVMALSYLAIDKSNYGWFAAAAVVVGIAAARAINRLDEGRRLYVVGIPLVSSDGGQLKKNGKLLERNVVVGSEDELLPQAKEALATARKKRALLTVREFMSGAGTRGLNDPEALWDKPLLVKRALGLVTALTYIIVLATLALFLAALALDIATR
jgi:hypothetical protein